MKKALDIITTTLLILVVVFAFLLVGVRLFGLEPYTVISGSMEPEYHVGSLIYVRKTTPEELEVNMPITYKMGNGVVVTHRIIDLVEDEATGEIKYITKGDANKDPDGTPVSFDRIIGRPVMHIPVLGYISYFVQNPPGVYIVIIVLALLVLLTFMPDLLREFVTLKKNETEEPSRAEEQESAELLAEADAAGESMNDSEEAEPERVPEEQTAEKSSEDNNQVG